MKEQCLIGYLNSVEVVKWRIPIDRKGFFASWISANKILLDDFTVKTPFKGFSKEYAE
jgi:hypothetical protein